MGKPGNTQGTGHKYSEGNQAAFKHGGAAAMERIKQGKSFVGLALEEEQRVSAEYEELGRLEMEKRSAIRLQTVSDMYFSAIQKVAQDGDLVALDRYVARWGWIIGVTLRAWDQVGKGEKKLNKKSIIDILQPTEKKEGKQNE
jgi:hypothetical protein